MGIYMFGKLQKPIRFVSALGLILGGLTLYSNEGSCETAPCTCMTINTEASRTWADCRKLDGSMVRETCMAKCKNYAYSTFCFGNNKWEGNGDIVTADPKMFLKQNGCDSVDHS